MIPILLIGPRKNKTDPKKIGGVIVLFEDLLRQCEARNVPYEVIDTNKANYNNILAAYLSIIFFLIIKIPRATHVSLHGTAKDYLFIAPIAVMVSKIFGKPVSLRKFAGNFIELFEGYSAVKRRIIVWTLQHATCNFFETRYLVAYFKAYHANTYWFPNVRARQEVVTESIYRKKFVFIGAVEPQKGIDVLCEAANGLPEDYQIDIYGKCSKEYTQEYFNNYRVQYRGILESENVTNTLQQYDILILPSFREGYPGVIIEALSVGLPIIATNLQGIREMVDAASSILVEPGNVQQLQEAIVSFQSDGYAQKSLAAKKQFENFDSDRQTAQFFKHIGL